MSYWQVLSEILLSALAGWQLADTWINGSVFKPIQKSLTDTVKDKQLDWGTRKAAELFSCHFCLSHYTIALCVAVRLLMPDSQGWMFVVYWFAAVRIAWLLDAIIPLAPVPFTEDLTEAVDAEIERQAQDEHEPNA